MDKLLKIGFKNIPARLILVDLSASWQQIKLNNIDYYLAYEILGQAAAASSLLISNIKFDGSVSLQIRANNHNLAILLAECNNQYGVRGLVNLRDNRYLDLSNLSNSDANFIVNILPRDKNLSPYQGIIPLYFDNDAFSMEKAINHYMKTSEQIDTCIWLASNQYKCVGILLQKIPIQGGYSNEKDEDWITISHLANTITHKEMLKWDLLTIINNVFNEYIEQGKLVVLEEHTMHFYCTCNYEKAVNALTIASNYQLDQDNFLEKNNALEVNCEFCNKRYRFNINEHGKITNDFGHKLN